MQRHVASGRATAGLCSNPDKLDPRATNPKTHPQASHARHHGARRQFAGDFRVFRRSYEVAAALL
jgi:hypothetical protein